MISNVAGADGIPRAITRGMLPKEWGERLDQAMYYSVVELNWRQVKVKLSLLCIALEVPPEWFVCCPLVLIKRRTRDLETGRREIQAELRGIFQALVDSGGMEDRLRRALPKPLDQLGPNDELQLVMDLDGECYQDLGKLLEQLEVYELASESYARAIPTAIERAHCTSRCAVTATMAGSYKIAVAVTTERLVHDQNFLSCRWIRQDLSYKRLRNATAGIVAFDIMAQGYLATNGLSPVVKQMYEMRQEASNSLLRDIQVQELEEVILAPGWVQDLGSLCCLQQLLRLRQLGWANWNKISLLSPRRSAANAVLIDYLRPHFSVVEDQRQIETLTSLAMSFMPFPYGGVPIADGSFLPMLQASGHISAASMGLEQPLQISPDSAQLRIARGLLHDLGLPSSAWYAVLYDYAQDLSPASPFSELSYQPWTREAVEQVAKSVAALGGWTVRVGCNNAPPMAGLPNFIDYRHSWARSDVCSAVIPADARFLICGSNSSYFLAEMFNIPALIVGWENPLAPAFARQRWYIPKEFSCEGSNGLITYEADVKAKWYQSRRFRDEEDRPSIVAKPLLTEDVARACSDIWSATKPGAEVSVSPTYDPSGLYPQAALSPSFAQRYQLLG